MWPVLQECLCSALHSAKVLAFVKVYLKHASVTTFSLTSLGTMYWFLFCVAIAMNPSQVLDTHIQDHLPLFVFLNTNTAPAP